MGHGEDPSARKSSQCTPERDSGEGEEVFCTYVCVYVEFGYNTRCCASQVNSKGYKVCGEASSVCGTITINKRKVGTFFYNFGKVWLESTFFQHLALHTW